MLTRRKDNICAAKLEEYKNRRLLLIMSIAIVNDDIAKRFEHFWENFQLFFIDLFLDIADKTSGSGVFDGVI